MKLKIYNGTPVGENLCEECEKFRSIKGIRESDEIRLCGALGKPIAFPVSQCSMSRAKSDLSLNGALYLYKEAATGKLMVYNAFGPDWTVEQYRGLCGGKPEEGSTTETVQ